MQHILLLTLHRSYNYEAIKADFEQRYVSFKIISVLCTDLSNFLQWLYKRAKLNLLRLTQLTLRHGLILLEVLCWEFLYGKNDTIL